MINLTNRKGITLIALVITILVLLILATISITALTGKNAILTKSKTAKMLTENADAEEQVKIAVWGSFNENGLLDINKLNIQLSKIDGCIINSTDFPVIVTIHNKYTFIIDNIGTITSQEENSVLDPST